MNLFAKLCVVFLVLIQNFFCNEKGRFLLEDRPLVATEGSCIEIKCSIERYIESGGAHWFWMKDAKYNEKRKDFDATVIYSTDNTTRPVSPDFAGRVKYIGSLQWNSYSSSEKCSVIICKLNKTDSGNYSVRFVRGIHKWKTTMEVNLTVTENPCPITFEKPPLLKESQNVTITCSTLSSCPSNLQIKSVAQLHPSTLSGPPGNNKQKSTTVSFEASWQDDGKEFSCQTHDNTDPYLIQNISLTIEYAPRDVSAKMSPENIREGQSLTLTCSANGQPVPTFTWFKDEENVSSKSEWDINQIKDSQSGDYYCEAKNNGGTIKSNKLVVNVTYEPEVEIKMTSLSTIVTEGDLITLTCEVKRSKPQPSTYSWSKGGTPIGWQNSYSFEHIRPEDSGSYTCSATNPVGTGTSVSHEIRVHYMPRNTRIPNKEHFEEVKVGGSLTFDCNTEAYPDPHRYSWHRYSQSKQTESDRKPEFFSGKSVTLKNIQRKDEACYTCNATNDIGTGMNSDPLCIRVLYPPTSLVLSMDTEDTEVTEGRLITISCSVESYPTSKLTFRKTSTSDRRSSEVQFLQAGNSNKLQHRFNVTSTHTGFYTCNAENSEGSRKSEQRELVVKYHPEDVRVEAKPGLVVNENTTLELLCRAKSHPPVTSVTWTKVTDGKEKTFSRTQIISLIVRPSDRGLYSCSATNEIGTGNSLQVQVKVRYAPKVTNIIRAAEQQHPDGKRYVTLSCSSQSYPSASEYTWYRRIKEEERNIKVSGSQNYTVYSDQPGLYYCIAKNEISEKMSDPIQLFVDRGLMKYLLLALIILLVIVLLVFVYRHKRRKSIQRGTTNTSSSFGSPGWWNRSRSGNLMNEPVMAEPFRSRDDLLPDQRCRPNGQRSQPPPDSTPASNINTVYSTVNLPAGKQGPSAQKPVRQRGGHADNESLNYASLHFENKKKKKQAKAEESAVYAIVSKQKQPKKKEQQILGDYENVSAVDAAKAPNPKKSDTDTSEDEVELNYSQVSFKAKPGHQRACRDSSSDTSSDTSSDSSTSDDEETQYSQVKV